MLNVSEDLWDIWNAGNFTGDNRPVTRATIQKAVLKDAAGQDIQSLYGSIVANTPTGNVRTLIFGQTEWEYEIPNIKMVSIDRRLGADAAQLNMTIRNQTAITEGDNLDLAHNGLATPSRRSLRELGKPGVYSYRRGVTPASAERWGHDVDYNWVDMLIPNRLIKVYQGYGTDDAAQPWLDTKLTLTGTFLIDTVDYQANGEIVITGRDLAKLLIEQRIYPPIVPLDFYPLEFCADSTKTTTETVPAVTDQVGTEEVIGANVARHSDGAYRGWDSSAAPWYSYNASVYGHRASHAFDGDHSTYWLSVGNSGPNQVWSYEWIEAKTNGEPINQIRVKPKWGGYVTYVAVMENGSWQGSSTVPYGYTSSPAYPNNSNVRYVKKLTLPRNENWQTIDLDKTYNAQYVRLIFTNLAYSGLGQYPYRAAVYEMEVRSYTPSTVETIEVSPETTVDVITPIPGNIDDYTDIVKVLAAWSGFFWPHGPTDNALADFGIKNGRVWGDFFYSGAYPVEPPCIDPSYWDNKSVMDGINQIKEILGFIFYVDHSGGIIWRMPNIWRTGNYVSGRGFVGYDSVRTIDEEKVLIDYGVSIDDTALRSEIVVVSSDDPTLYTAIQPGFSSGEVIPSAVGDFGDLSLLGGQERVMLVPNYPFISQDEVNKFAYLVSLWIHWAYRKGRVRIPGNPAFMPDDQVRIYERVTSEAYVHYIQGVNSVMDLDNGTWFMDLTTNWLGEGPSAQWLVQTYSDMPASLFAYLKAIGEIDEDTDPAAYPDDWIVYDPPTFPETDVYERVENDYADILANLPDTDYSTITINTDEGDIDVVVGGGSTGSPSGTVPDDSSISNATGVHWRSEAWKFAYWGGVCTAQPYTTITLMTPWNSRYDSPGWPISDIPSNTHPNQTVYAKSYVNATMAKAYLLMGQIFAKYDYEVKSSASYNCRHIGNKESKPWSSHAWGLAIDINPTLNPYAKEGSTYYNITNWLNRTHPDYPNSSQSAFLSAAKEITTRIVTAQSGLQVFGWGGYWSSAKDWMHFDVVVSRKQAQEGFRLR